MIPPRHEAGGGIPALGVLFSETLEDLTTNFQGYLLLGLAWLVAVLPLTLFVAFGSMFGMYVVMGLGIGGSVLAARVVAERSGDQDLSGLVAMVGSLVSVGGALVLFFGVLVLLGAVLAPLIASFTRAVAAHQRGEGELSFQSGFATLRQDLPATIGVSMFTGAAGILGVLFCYVGALVPAVLFGFSHNLVTLHRKGAREALGIAARHAIARPTEHITVILALMGTSLVAAYVPVVGQMFTLALGVRAYRKMYGDGPEPVQ